MASICPKGHHPAGPSVPCCVCPSGAPHGRLVESPELPRRPLRQTLHQLGTPARLLPQPCSLCLCSCCQVRKYCEWCRALICRHEKPSALLKGRPACCHSETGKGLHRGGAFSPSGEKMTPSPGQGRSSWRMKQEEGEEMIFIYQVRFSLA